MLILFLFFCSGATALVYEVIWSKYLSLLFGSTIQAQTVVLAVFMGGLALGNKLFGRYADRAPSPLKLYGRLEIIIGLYAFAFTALYRLADSLFATAGAGLLGHGGWLLLLKGLLGAALLLGPTILMGGTLPVLAAWLERHTPDASRRSARFYSTNSFGAVCGAGLSGFFLVPQFGLSRTLALAAVLNVLVGLTALFLAGRRPAAQTEAERNAAAVDEPGTAPEIFHWGCVLVAVTGAVSMGLEVLASRCLCLIFGASLQVFAIVLMAFILGISVGSAVIASPRHRQWPREITSMGLLLVAAGIIGLLVYNIENLAALYVYAKDGLQRTYMGYCYHQILVTLISLLVLGLPAAVLGSVLPLWMRGAETQRHLADRVGRLLTWNTLGAVGGVLLTGFVLLPVIGLRGSFAVAAMVLVVTAFFTALATRRRLAAAGVVVLGMLILIVTAGGGQDWRYVFCLEIFRLPDMDFTQPGTTFSAFKAGWQKGERIIYYKDAADATVAVLAEQRAGLPDNLALLINGKPDASSYVDQATQILLAQLPLMAKPDSKDVFCFGMGSGMTAGSALGYPIEHLTVAENCAPVLAAAACFAPWNHGVLTNDRVRIVHEDARTVLKLDAKQYDVIISEPSNPWTVGIGSVFTREFYELAASRLKPGGLMAQWFHTYEMNDDVIKMVVRTFGSAFPSMEIWDLGSGDIMLLGSARPWKSNPEVYRRAFELAGPRGDLNAIGLNSPEGVMVRQLASQRTAFAVAGPGRRQQDDVPALEYEAPRAFYIWQGRSAQGLQHYDERTWQVELAPSEKNRGLAGVGAANALEILREPFGSMNSELMSYLNAVAKGQTGREQGMLMAMPCIFQGTNGMMLFMPLSAQTNAVARQLFDAEVAIKTGSINQMDALTSIKSILAAMPVDSLPDRGRSADYYADLGIKTSLRLGNAALAKAILLQALQLDPHSESLGYLARIMVREGLLRADEINLQGLQ